MPESLANSCRIKPMLQASPQRTSKSNKRARHFCCCCIETGGERKDETQVPIKANGAVLCLHLFGLPVHPLLLLSAPPCLDASCEHCLIVIWCRVQRNQMNC